MIRRPPRSTLFPYTDALPISLGGDASVPVVERAGAVLHFHILEPRVLARRLIEVAVQADEAPVHGRDRKSTRLNSSHSQISYAVFCLKKKKNLSIRRAITQRA